MILNVFKHHKHHLPHLHTSTCFETGSKSLSRTTAKKINSLCLDAFDTDGAQLQIQMGDRSINLQHLSQFLAECDCAMQGFDFTDDSHHNIYSPCTQSSTTPRPLHHRRDSPSNWCQRPCYLTSRLWLRPDHHEMHSESNPLLMPAEKTQISMLWYQSAWT